MYTREQVLVNKKHTEQDIILQNGSVCSQSDETDCEQTEAEDCNSNSGES
jgi:hypothetical protein